MAVALIPEGLSRKQSCSKTRCWNFAVVKFAGSGLSLM